MVMKCFDVYLVALDPTLGSEIKKTRPAPHRLAGRDEPTPCHGHCGPDDHVVSDYPTRVACTFQGKGGQVVLDQLRTVDKVRLVKRLGRIGPSVQTAVLAGLGEMFAE